MRAQGRQRVMRLFRLCRMVMSAAMVYSEYDSRPMFLTHAFPILGRRKGTVTIPLRDRLAAKLLVHCSLTETLVSLLMYI